MSEQILINGDSKNKLKEIQDGSVDYLLTDPPYGISFMNKGWDKVLPDVEVWSECFRVLKPGSFISVMSSPRSDVLYRMIKDLEEAGFDMSFSPILWTYHTGFPKASDTSKMIDRRLGVDREVVGKNPNNRPNSPKDNTKGDYNPNSEGNKVITKSTTDLGKKYEGSKLGFQPKPAIEHVIVGMKPHGQKSYIDNVLNFEALPDNVKRTYPFLQTPKPSKKEKDLGLSGEEKETAVTNMGKRCNKCNKTEMSGSGNFCECETSDWKYPTKKNTHPTVKPVKLMSYLTTLFTREGDYVLDPFMGSGTTGLSSKLLNRNFIGIELEEDSFNISTERLSVERDTLINYFKDVLTNEQTKLDI